MNRDKYGKPRPSIPEKLKREIKISQGHKCAVYGCNVPHGDIHHIDGNRENNCFENLVFLCKTHHDYAHRNIIGRKDLHDYKLGRFLLDERQILRNFYYEHVKSIDRLLGLQYWLDISNDLSCWRIKEDDFDRFNQGIKLIDNTNYPKVFPELSKSILDLADALHNLLRHFHNEKIVLTEPIRFWRYESWKNIWYSQEEYDRRYAEMEKWRKGLDKCHGDLIMSLNKFAEEVWKNIDPNYRNRMKFTEAE